MATRAFQHGAVQASTVRVLGSRVHLLTARETVDHIQRWVDMPDSRCRQVVVTGFHGLWEAHKDAEVRAVLNKAEIWAPDGIAPVWVARLRGYHEAQRAPGAEIMREFFRRADEKGYSSFFYGDTNATQEALQKELKRRYPRHRIAGAISPPFRRLTREEDDKIIETINAARPDVLWVALGTPKQDRWIHDKLSRLKVPVAVGVGAAFAFVAGTVQRCPEWVGKMGCEWVFRFLKEPKKLWRRDLIDGPRFLFHLGLDLARLRRNS